MVTKIKEKVESVLIKTGSLLSKEIGLIKSDYAKLDYRLHIAACSAIRLASRDGRCDWLNELYRDVQKGHQDALRAWLVPTKAIFTDAQWLKFDKKIGDATGIYFSTIPGTEKLRPDRETGEFVEGGRIEAVANDLNLMFVKTGAAENAKAIATWDETLLKRFDALLTFAKKQQAENPNMPRDIVETLEAGRHRIGGDVLAFRSPKVAAALNQRVEGDVKDGTNG